MGLKKYRAKRDFARTSEPSGSTPKLQSRPGRAPKSTGKRLFVVQKHAASRLHYDFRLEMEGVLKSWAVPKGFPTSKGDRRLAVEVEDHPLEYGHFEGTIPKGNYGAGTVMVWDTGTYEVSGDHPRRALSSGKLHFRLQGKKLKGEWTLVRLRGSEADKPQWLLLKTGETAPPFSSRAEHRSAITGRTLEQIAAVGDRVWESNRAPARSTPRTPTARLPAATRRNPEELPRSARLRRMAGRTPRTRPAKAAAGTAHPTELDLRTLPSAEAAFIEPMKAVLVDKLPRGEDWICELKFDGVRAVAVKIDEEVTLFSRSRQNLMLKYYEVAQSLKKLPADSAVLDGEMVALDSQGRPSFQLLQAYHMSHEKPPLIYYVFDLLNVDGKDLLKLPLETRKKAAQELLRGMAPNVRFSSGINADSEKLMRELQKRGLEGLVAKRAGSRYEPGRRSGAWVKFKWTNQQEFVIGGFTEPRGSRSNFGALLVGYYEGGRLFFAGKVGTGFGQELLASLHRRFQPLVRRGCPFANLPEKRGSGRFGAGLTASQMRRCIWLEPRLVCEVRFAEWTRDHHLRQPAFLGLREDKSPRDVVREKPGSRAP
jgi:bifunctional non-homologous end joining protein LigD